MPPVYERTESVDLVERKVVEVASVVGDEAANSMLAKGWEIIDTHAVASDVQPIKVVYVLGRVEDEVLERTELEP
jgi:hypothetical protein